MRLKMKARQEVTAVTWFQAAEILGISCRQMQRWHTRFEHEGYEGLFDRRRGVPSPKRVPLATVEEVLRLYQEQYFAFNVRHFHEKLVEEHKIRLSYSWVKQALQGAGLVRRWHARPNFRHKLTRPLFETGGWHYEMLGISESYVLMRH